MRPLYESAANVRIQERAREFLAQRWGAVIHTMPRLYSCDFFVESPKKALIEFKFRTYTAAWIDSIGGYELQATKLASGLALHHALRIPVLLVVAFGCGSIYMIEYRNVDPSNIFLGGRWDRGDPADRQPYIPIPLATMKLLRAANEAQPEHSTNGTRDR